MKLVGQRSEAVGFFAQAVDADDAAFVLLRGRVLCFFDGLLELRDSRCKHAVFTVHFTEGEFLLADFLLQLLYLLLQLRC